MDCDYCSGSGYYNLISMYEQTGPMRTMQLRKMCGGCFKVYLGSQHGMMTATAKNISRFGQK